jgi:F0F1-type ATP synthase assembly protein I
MADIHIGKAPPLRVVLPFYATGAVFFLILTILLFLASSDLTGHYFSPHLLAIVHTAALGWGTMIIFGAAYELLPVLCENDLYSKRLAMASFVLLTAGVAHLIPAFWWFKAGTLMITGGSLVFLATLCYVCNVLFTAENCKQHSLHKQFLISSAMWLLVTVTLGLCLAVNLRYPFMSRNHLDIMKLHAHVGLAGWFLQLITGVSVKLVPMFLVSKTDKTKWVKTAWLFQNAGLILFLVDGHINNSSNRDLLYGSVVGAGIGFWLYFLIDVRKNRLRKKIDLPMKHTLLSFGFLVVALVIMPIAYYSPQTKWTLVYGVFLFLGWLTSILLGQTFKTLPFIIWNEHYKQLTGRNAVPLPGDLYDGKILKYQFYIYLIALISLVTGMILNVPIIIKTALLFWILLALLYLINVTKILLHKPPHNNGFTA